MFMDRRSTFASMGNTDSESDALSDADTESVAVDESADFVVLDAVKPNTRLRTRSRLETCQTMLVEYGNQGGDGCLHEHNLCSQIYNVFHCLISSPDILSQHLCVNTYSIEQFKSNVFSQSYVTFNNLWHDFFYHLMIFHLLFRLIGINSFIDIILDFFMLGVWINL